MIWCNLKDPHKDLDFCDRVEKYLGSLRDQGAIEGFRLTRRKLGFGPEALGEFMIDIHAKDLAQLDSAFNRAAARAAPLEGLHAAVYSAITDFRSALYRDFPDPVRRRPSPPPA